MYLLFFSVSFLLSVGLSTASSAICSSGIYQQLQPLASYAPAQSYCTAHYPVALVTVTASTIATSTISAGTTTTTTITSVETDTSTLSTATTETDTATTTLTVLPTVTITVAAKAKARRDLFNRAPVPAKSTSITTTKSTSTTTSKPTSTTTSKPTSTTTSKAASTTSSKVTTTSTTGGSGLSSLLASLESQAAGIISTLCSCIETPLTTTTTLTSTTTTTVINKATVTATAATTTTIVITVAATATTTTTETDTTTSTVTVTNTCPSPSTLACNSCVDLQTDDNNCGSCGNVCATGLYCTAGTCQQPEACAPPGNAIYYCNSASTCACYETTENRGACVIAGGSCASSCSTSADCGHNNVCLTGDSTGCGYNSCSTTNDYNSCENSASTKRLFRPRAPAALFPRVTFRKLPDANSTDTQ